MRKLLIAFVAWAALFGAVSSLAQTTAQAESFVRHLYSEYDDPKKPNGPDFLYKESSLIFSPAIINLIRYDQRHTHKGDVGKLDGDPICDCQDWDKLSIFKLDLAKTGDKTALANVTITNMGSQVPLKLFLLWTPKGWRIDDISSSDMPSLKKFLQSP
jgi:hypothetical protein